MLVVAEVSIVDIGVGQVVYSIAGRDADRKFIVVEIIDDCRVKVSDGDLRRIEKAKLKKLKHLKVTKTFVLSLAEKYKKVRKYQMQKFVKPWRISITKKEMVHR